VDILGAVQLHLSPYSVLLQHVCEYALTLGGHLRFRHDNTRPHCAKSGSKAGDMAQADVQRLLRYLRTAAPGWQVRQAVAELRVQALVRRYNRLCAASFFRSARTREMGGTLLSMLELGQDQGAVVKHDEYFTSIAVRWPADASTQPGCIAHCAAVLRRPSLWNAGWQPMGTPVCINAPCYEAWRAGRLGLSPDEYDASCMGAEEVLPSAPRPHRRQQVCHSGTAAAPALVMAEVMGENQVVFVQQAQCRRTGRTAVVLAHVLILKPVGRSISDISWNFPEEHSCFYPVDDAGLGGAVWQARSAAMRTRQLLRARLHTSGKVKAD